MSPLEENLAFLADVLFHQVVTEHRTATFNPERYDEHKKLADAAKRSTTPPPAIPPITPVALRPAGWQSLTAALTAAREPVIEEIEGHEAHERLQALLNN